MQKLSLAVGTPENRKPGGQFESKFKVGNGGGVTGSNNNKPLTRSNSTRSKGISMNLAVSPMTTPNIMTSNARITPGSRLRSVSGVSPQTLPLGELSEFPRTPTPPEGLKYDLPLPQMEMLVSMDIGDQMRLLALKEMCIVEIKDNITNMNTKLARHEQDLHKLREVIQKSLYKELSSSSLPFDGNPSTTKTRHQRQNSNPREEAIASTKRSRRRTLSSSSHPTPIVNPQPTNAANENNNSKLWSNLSKPLNLIQQFDAMLQNEFEKSLTTHPQERTTSQQRPSRHSDEVPHPVDPVASHKSKPSEDSISSIGSITSPLKSKSRLGIKGTDLDQDFPPSTSNVFVTQATKPTGARNTEDMLQTVSSSIWSFVNDVKSNVLSSLSEEEFNGIKGGESRKSNPDLTPVYNLDTGSTISLTKDSSGDNTVTMQDEEATNSDYDEDLFDPVGDDDNEKIDLSMYSGMRKK